MKQHFYIPLLIAVLFSAAVSSVSAQDNVWERQPEKSQASSDARYLKGAVPEENGKVTFTATIPFGTLSKQEVYGRLLQFMTRLTKEEGQFEQSRITLADSATHSQIVGSYQEWLVFKNKPLNLDRTRLLYHLIADLGSDAVTLKMTRIVYLYDEEREPTTYRAEEWINDRYGLNRTQTKLARVSGKFRRKTIDRKDYLFNAIEKVIAGQ